MTPSFIGLMATILPGVRPSISLASLPTASTRPLILLIATIDGSLTTMPLPRAKTHVLAVPRSIARSLENRDKRELNTFDPFHRQTRRAMRLRNVDAAVAIPQQQQVIEESET